MSQGSTAQGGKGVASAAEPTTPAATTGTTGGAAGRTSSVRWVVLFTGRKATEDYQPSSSEGEDPALVKEVTNVCLALHPHSEIRLFPQSGEALLYYRAQTTGETVVTRVSTAPNPDGVRTALEYCSLILTASQFGTLLGGDPFVAARATDLFSLVRTRFLSGARTPIAAGTPSAKSAAKTAASAATLSDAPAFTVGAPGEEPLSTEENVAALESYCAAAAAAGKPIPTFATWWSSSGVVPPGIFEIVLRASAARAPTLREATDQLAEFAADLKSSLPKASADDLVANDLTRAILASVGAAQQSVTHAGAHINTETPVQFQTQLTEAALQCENLVRDITALTGRQTSGLDTINTLHLTTLALRAEELTRDLPRVRHPNPFGRRSPAPESDAENGASTTSSANGSARRDTSNTGTAPIYEGSKGKIAIGVLVAAILGLGVWGLMSHNAPPPKPAPHRPVKRVKKPGVPPQNVAATPLAGSVATPASHATPLPAIAILIAKQILVEPVARDSAQEAASNAVKAKKGSLSEDALDAIVARAIDAGYKEFLPADQYAIAYAPGSKPWTYARYKAAIPNLTSSVYEAASGGVEEGKEALKLAAIQAGKTEEPTPEPTHKPRHDEPTPEPTHKPRHSEPTPEPTHKPRHVEETPAPPKKHATPRPGNPPATPGVQAGSAGQTGL